jgi:antitoxin VapB
MAETRRAKLFENGSNQCVLLPAEFRFDGDEVLISRDEITQQVTLSPEPDVKAWEEFLALRRPELVPEDWMKDRPLNRISQDREPLFPEED